MKKFLALSASFVSLSVLIISLGLGSCKKDEPTIVKIKVVDPDGYAVKDANVHIYGRPSDPNNTQTPNKDLDQNRTTDGAGMASFDLSNLTKPGQAGFIVLDIDVTKLDQRGVGIINVEEGKTNSKTVTIQ